VNNKNNKSTKKSMVPGLIVLAAVMIFNLVAEASGDATVMIIAIVSCVVVALIVVITLAAVKKAASRAGAQERPVRPAAPAARRASVFAHPGEQEEAVHCAHVRGRQKYIEQLDSYLKNGIIDKAEYRVLRERYEKLDLPDDYH
jgi:hypothetical protein